MQTAEKVTISDQEYNSFYIEVLAEMSQKGFIQGFLADQIKWNPSITFDSLKGLGELQVDFSPVLNQITKIDIQRGKKLISMVISFWLNSDENIQCFNLSTFPDIYSHFCLEEVSNRLS